MNSLIAVSIGFVLDLIIGDPAWLCRRISHPIIWIGKLIGKVEKWIREKAGIDQKKQRILGCVLVLVVVLITGGVTYGILWLSAYLHPMLGFVVETILCYQIFATKSLKTESMKVYIALESGTLDEARTMVSYIVGRDTKVLDEEGVIKATVETVAENTTDGVIAPMIYMVLFGATGGMVYKAINTMDSMVGYKNETYRYFGTAAAILDDIVNYIPARVTALLMIGAAGVTGFSMKNSFAMWRRDRRNHKSPNSAQTESVCAGALEVQLAGNAYYFGTLYEKPTIGEKLREIEQEDIKRANKLLYGTACLGMMIAIAISVACMAIYGTYLI